MEDSPSARAIVSEEMESQGYEIMTANDVTDLERRLLSQPDILKRVDMFILDLEMPQMMGTQIGAVIEQIYEELKDVPFIIYSARPAGEVQIQVEETSSYAGRFSKNYKGYIQKEAGSTEKLVAKVEEVMANLPGKL